jgi:uncharacterized membrane protein
MRKTIAKAVTWRLIGTAEIFAISFWTTGHIATAGHTAGIAAITSFLMYVAHELAWSRHEPGGLIPIRGSQRPQVETGREPAVAKKSRFDVEPGQIGRDNCPQSIHTHCVPRIPIARAAPCARSSMTPRVNGPRSFIVTVADALV